MWASLLIFLLLFTLGGLGREHEDVSAQALPSRSNLVPSQESLRRVDQGNPGGASSCKSGIPCSKLGIQCLKCNFNYSCEYGKKTQVSCQPLKDMIVCSGNRTVIRQFTCRYCYQTWEWEHVCTGMAGCNARAAPQQTYRANCTVKPNVICLGNRSFPKNLRCKWTAGASWSTALALSITLGGFGADRFYLGHWQEGIGKLFSFGGLGVWTLVDVVLVAIRYLGPADGSLYAS